MQYSHTPLQKYGNSLSASHLKDKATRNHHVFHIQSSSSPAQHNREGAQSPQPRRNILCDRKYIPSGFEGFYFSVFENTTFRVIFFSAI